MTLSKTSIAGIAAVAVVAALGIARRRRSSEDEIEQPDQLDSR